MLFRSRRNIAWVEEHVAGMTQNYVISIATKAIQVHKETPTVQLTTIEQVQAAVGNQQKPNKEREVQATEKE